MDQYLPHCLHDMSSSSSSEDSLSGSNVSWASFFAANIFVNAAFALFCLSSSSISRHFKTSEDVKISPAFAWTCFLFLLELATVSLVAYDIGGAMVSVIALWSSFLGGVDHRLFLAWWTWFRFTGSRNMVLYIFWVSDDIRVKWSKARASKTTYQMTCWFLFPQLL